MMSVPVMSLGIRSGVNWTRLNERWSASATVWTISVLASPGTPMSRAWPPLRMAVRMPSTTSSWPDDPLGHLAAQPDDRLGQALELLDVVVRRWLRLRSSDL